MSYWIAFNRDEAQISTLNQLIGKLTIMKKFGKEPTCDELLEFIKKTVEEETERLDKAFPNKGAKKEGTA